MTFLDKPEGKTIKFSGIVQTWAVNNFYSVFEQVKWVFHNCVTEIGKCMTSTFFKAFGVSRLKIDPSLTGVENIPQARVTLEQQVSRDITLTYITNLSRTQEQIVRVQWDINRRWSAIAVREENGVFGIDFQYRKRF